MQNISVLSLKSLFDKLKYAFDNFGQIAGKMKSNYDSVSKEELVELIKFTSSKLDNGEETVENKKILDALDAFYKNRSLMNQLEENRKDLVELVNSIENYLSQNKSDDEELNGQISDKLDQVKKLIR
ncbi:hypothetical protein Mia14_0216 [Candidatus Mancarchaeum acidiphilum]|uniref:Uncharacterized protein n=1 Tax=Candidatus Mancarchaeum acidiphilum TaxID=1920749 RepID=A0A218NM49_9ARCH|nr:hypothetical protein [Candidatus Mancarchaeum acidiphilum]ASI13550.1 hypothetical protein Mia14_0216 [Candidatus Mancarchaeum acidiphilum]